MKLQAFAAAISSHGHAPATETSIAQFENTIGHALPSDYRAFLMISGGGYMAAQPSFNWPNGSWAGRVHTVGGLRDDEDYSLLHQWREPQWKLPQDFIWILRDHGGNPVGLTLSGTEVGHIFFLDHEIEPEEDEWDGTITSGLDSGYLLPLAPSFNAFIGAMLETR